MRITTYSLSNASKSAKLDKTSRWHERLGHINEKGYYMDRKYVFDKDLVSKLDFCENCILGKQYRLSFKFSIGKEVYIRLHSF